MEIFGKVILLLGIIAVVALVISFVHARDRDRILDYIESRGGYVESIKWKLFGPGWLGARNQTIYHVVYKDNQHALHDAYCMTSFLSGVYFTQDWILKESPVAIKKERDAHALQSENRRLREELDALKRRENRDGNHRDGNHDAQP